MRWLWRIHNLLWYGRWTDCTHGRWPEEWQPVGFADWECPKCGATK